MMRIFTVPICNGLSNRRLPIGRQGENGVTQIRFDASTWIAEYGSGNLYLLARREIDPEPYPVAISESAGIAVWTVSNADTAVHGIGQCELQWLRDGRVLKSQIFETICARSLGDDAAEPPEPWQAWVDMVLKAADDAQAVAGVVGIVGTYAELMDYDTSKIDSQSIVKVLIDSTHSNEMSYYRWVIDGGVGSWVYVGKAVGADGTDGFSPTVEISKSGTVTTITITDINGTHTATINDGSDANVPVATASVLGGIKVGANLTISPEGVLSVDTANVVEQDNTKPITSAAVHTEIGNIDALLAAL